MIPELQNQIQSAIKYFDLEAAIKIISTLQKTGELDMSDPDILKLYYIRINSLSTNQLYEVLKSSMLVAYEIEDYKLSESLKEFFLQYNFIPEEVELCSKIIKLLQTSEEVLGTKYISLLGKDTAPYIHYWISDHANAVGSKKRDALSLMQYLNTSPNVKTLTQHERYILKDVLEIYDYCEDIVSLWEQLPDKIDDRDIEASQQAFDWTPLVMGFPDDTDGISGSSTPVQTPTVPAITRSTPKLPEFDSARPTPSPTLSENKFTRPADSLPTDVTPQPKPSMNVPNQYATNAGKVNELINHKPKSKIGVVMDPTNVKLEDEKRRLSQDRSDQTDMIQFKLTELRNRNKTEDQNSQKTK